MPQTSAARDARAALHGTRRHLPEAKQHVDVVAVVLHHPLLGIQRQRHGVADGQGPHEAQASHVRDPSGQAGLESSDPSRIRQRLCEQQAELLRSESGLQAVCGGKSEDGVQTSPEVGDRDNPEDPIVDPTKAAQSPLERRRDNKHQKHGSAGASWVVLAPVQERAPSPQKTRQHNGKQSCDAQRLRGEAHQVQGERADVHQGPPLRRRACFPHSATRVALPSGAQAVARIQQLKADNLIMSDECAMCRFS
mmetsp:Transcript_96941/g.278492  ORF Transcript_96941/g.278492 Transcript_96941/m.278492 type:complete len:251 (+) Transcript_96941:154-906(+)